MNVKDRIEQRRLNQVCPCRETIGSGGHHSVGLHERWEQRQQPRWLNRAGKDLTGALR